jgi:hypothetical protein
MSPKQLTIVLAVLTAFVAQAAAQKNELAGLVGRTFVSDQGIKGARSSTTIFTSAMVSASRWTMPATC